MGEGGGLTYDSAAPVPVSRRKRECGFVLMGRSAYYVNTFIHFR